MNRISLTMKSNLLEKEYHLQQMKENRTKLKLILFVYLAISLMNLINLSIDYLSRQTEDQESYNLQQTEYYLILTFLIAWILSVIMNLILFHLVPSKINIYYFTQLIINVFYHLILIYFKLNTSEGISKTENQQRVQFHVQEGIFLAIILFRGLIGTAFLLKIGVASFAIISLLVMSFDQQEKPYIQIPIGAICLFIISFQMYDEDKNKRLDFLVRRKDEEWNKIIKNVLPTNLIIAKFNAREERIELEQANRKASRELGINDNESFSKFTNQTFVQKNEIISNEKDLNLFLQRNKSQTGAPLSQTDVKFNENLGINGHGNLSIAGVSQNNALNYSNNSSYGKKEQKNTLSSLIRQKIDEELKNKKVAMSSGIIIDHDEEMNQNDGASIKSTRKFSHSNQARRKISCQFGNEIKKVNEFIGTYKSNGFDVDKKLMIRVSTFSLNDVFAVITIENETYREKYIKQIKFNTFLEKIFSFQLKKFKESYQIVLNELNRIRNPQVQNQLLYHNVKCVNRVNSYLQYFEFKNATKHEFQVTTFSLNSEIYKILNSLKHYILRKRIRTFYENVTNIQMISTDEERLQQIFFMIFEHLLVNSPEDGYMAIRITKDQTISNCFKIQIQSTYNSDLLNTISLQTFSIDELYSDYEIYQNYFVSLRIAIKLITLMGPYNKIDFQRPKPGILYTSFSIFSDLEVIKQQQQVRIFSNQNQHQLAGNLQLPSNNKIQCIVNSISKNNQSPGLKPESLIPSENVSFLKRSELNLNNNHKQNKKLALDKNGEANSIDMQEDSPHASDLYDEEDSFNEWFKLKQQKFSSLSNNEKQFDATASEDMNFNYLKSKPPDLPQFAPTPHLIPQNYDNQLNRSESPPIFFKQQQSQSQQQDSNSSPSINAMQNQLNFEADTIYTAHKNSPPNMMISSSSFSKQELFNGENYNQRKSNSFNHIEMIQDEMKNSSSTQRKDSKNLINMTQLNNSINLFRGGGKFSEESNNFISQNKLEDEELL